MQPAEVSPWFSQSANYVYAKGQRAKLMANEMRESPELIYLGIPAYNAILS